MRGALRVSQLNETRARHTWERVTVVEEDLTPDALTFFVWRLQQRKETSGSVLQRARAKGKPSSTDINGAVVLFESAEDIAFKLFLLDALLSVITAVDPCVTNLTFR